jgi:hypothetical protein
MESEAQSIDDVIRRLTEIITWSRENSSRLGYFAALYRKVTRAVKARTDQGDFFDDNERMERLDVIFANRYLAALDRYRAGDKVTRSWNYAFAAARQSWPIVLQHLLLGMNAHINLDLGIAAARTAPGGQLGALHHDFNRINKILAGLVDDAQRDLAQIWPTLRFLNRFLGHVDDAVINFSMERARDSAWSVAERLAPMDDAERERAIDQLDQQVAVFAHVIRHPGWVLGTVTKIIRVGEIGTIRRKIDALR